MIKMVHLVEVDVVNAEATKTAFYRGVNVFGGGSSSIRVGTRGKADFCRDDDLLSLRPQQAAKNLLRGATAVDVGGIEEVASCITKHFDDPFGFSAIATPSGHTKVHGAQADLRNHQS